METVALLVSTAKGWYATARMPRALANAGFTVAVLTPQQALVEASAYVAKIGRLPDNATPMQWVYAFAATVKATAPRIVVPCDDMAFRLLRSLVLAPPADMVPTLQQELATLIVDSLGDPTGYRPGTDPLLLPQAARALDVRVPDSAIVENAAEAEAFAAIHGYPLTVRRSQFGATGAASCADAPALRAAFAELSRLEARDPDAASDRRLLVQSAVRGRAQSWSFVAWRGAVLGGFGGDKLVVHPPPFGPASVLRLHRSDAVRDVADHLARGFGLSGFFGVDCVLDEATGEPLLVELTRFVTPSAHCGCAYDVDLPVALHAALHGAASPSRDALAPEEEHVAVLFPQEWLRDPESEHLRDYPVDMPWDDPKLLEAMLAVAE